MKTTNDIIKSAISVGVLTEKDCNLIFRRMNNGKKSEIDWNLIWDNEGIKLTPEQSEKGWKWLYNLYKTPKGKERKNNPFGCREIDTLTHFSHCELVDYYDNGNKWFSYFVPVYRVVGLPGSPNFDYYMQGGQIIICG